MYRHETYLNRNIGPKKNSRLKGKSRKKRPKNFFYILEKLKIWRCILFIYFFFILRMSGVCCVIFLKYIYIYISSWNYLRLTQREWDIRGQYPLDHASVFVARDKIGGDIITPPPVILLLFFFFYLSSSSSFSSDAFFSLGMYFYLL